MMSRRRFGALAGGSLLASALPACAGPAASSGASGDTLTRIGFQLYSIRETFEASPRAAIEAAAAAGYSEVQLSAGGYFERDPLELKAILGDTGLTSPSIHVSFDQFEDQLDRAIMIAQTVGAEYVILPSIPPKMRKSLEDWKAVAVKCNAAAKRLADEGLIFGYHNHAFEFEPVTGTTTGYDILTGETDPDLVTLELDLYWALTANRDPLELIDQHAGRIQVCHVKDRLSNGEMTMVGEGVVDFQSYFLHAKKAGLKHYLVEFDRLLTADIPRMRAAADHLRGMKIS